MSPIPSPLRFLTRRRSVESTIRAQMQSLLALPEALIGPIGPGDFLEVGESLVEMLRREADLGPADVVLDLGCGLGRVAIPLQRLLKDGAYEGMDVVPAYVEWDRAQITSRSPSFRFRLLDVHSSMYNPASGNEPAGVTFPYPDAHFTIAIATSLFSHLLPDATRRYFAETARVLRPGGRVVFTFFLLDEVTRERSRRLETYPTFTETFEHGLLNNLERPEDAVAYDVDWLLAALREAGLEPRMPVRWGKWSGKPDPLSYQDVIIADRR